MVDEGLISREEAVARIDPAQLDQLLHPMIDPARRHQEVARGLNASPGAASGGIVFDADTAVERAKAEAGDPRPLGDDARRHPRHDRRAGDPHRPRRDDLARGCRRARAWASRASPAATGSCSATAIARLGGHELHEGDVITIDGGTGRVFVGAIPLVPPQLNEDFETILGWADELRRLKVRANADNPADAARAREFGAAGHRPLPHRAHVLRRGAAAGRPGDDPRRERGRPPRGARPAAAVPAVRLRGHLRGDGRPAGDDPPARPAAARVPAVRGPGDRRAHARPHPRAARDEPDARHARLPARADVPGDLRDADPRDRARVPHGAGANRRGAARRDHAPARRIRRGAPPARASSPSGLGRGGAGHRPHGRHDDRAAARVHAAPARSPSTPSSSRSARTTSRRRRSASRATTPRASSSRATSRTACSSATRSRCSTRTASAT